MTVNRWLKVSDELNDDRVVSVAGSVGRPTPSLVNIHSGDQAMTFGWDEWQRLLPLVNKLTREWRAVASDADAEHEAAQDAAIAHYEGNRERYD